METLQSLIEDGAARMIGVSNWRPERIREANAYADAHGLTRLIANQPQFSLAEQRFFLDPTTRGMDAETWRMHREAGMPCFCFSSQAHGYFTRLDTRGEDALTDNLRREFDCPENRAILERIRTVRTETGLSAGSIALAWLTAQPFPTFPLVGASKVEHVLALREAGDAVLTDAQRDLLRTVV
jgi:aryl-alcohol dehydrogenase-like predicted oxidoreductase